MKVLLINLGNFGSTGRIVRGIIKCIRSNADNCWIFAYPSNKNNTTPEKEDYILCSLFYRKTMAIVSFITGYTACFSALATWRLLHRCKKDLPDIIHFHNLHKSYINVPMIFRFIKENNIPVIWTLHDCWAFTGRCPHFIVTKCEYWKTGCHDCPYPRMAYPEAFCDRSEQMWQLKKEWFTGIENMIIVTPSQWLADLVKQSFLKEYPVKVIHNGIDLSVFRPTESEFRQKYWIADDQYLVLGVAFGWGERKGLDVFIDLAIRLDPNRYRIVLVGTNDAVEKQLPNNIISIQHTQNQKELAEIYTAADVFVNPTREDNFPTVNIEALACGTPVITFDTGGSPECIDESCGLVVSVDDVETLAKEIERVCEDKSFSQMACIKRALHFDQKKKFQEYVELYETMTRNE